MSDLGLGAGFISSGSWTTPNSAAYFPDPFCDMASLAMPETIQYALRWCFPPDTLIELGDGTLKAICEIVPGDKVLTRGRTIEKVTTISGRYYSGDLVHFTVGGMGNNLPIRVTPNHKFLVLPNIDASFDQQVEKRADELIVGDCIATPIYAGDVRLVSSHDVELVDFVAHNVSGLACNKVLSADVFKFNLETKLQLLGTWLDGDGSLKQGKASFNGICGFTCSKVLAYQLLRLSNSIGLCPTLTKHGQRNCYNLSFNLADSAKLKAYSRKLAVCNFVPHYSQVNRKAKLRDNYVIRRITSTSSVPYNGIVHNFEVENDHSYVANGICVSNCEYLMHSNGTYFRALDRIVSYFLTEVEISDIDDDDEKEKIENFLTSPDGLDIMDEMHTAALNYLCYGNYFSSLLMPFKRYLSCKQCGLEMQLKHVYNDPIFAFKWTDDCCFHATCPKCKYSGEWNHIDRRGGSDGKVIVKNWNVHEMEILWDPYTGESEYIYKIPDEYRKLIKKGHLFHLERIPTELIQCIKNNSHLKFEKEAIFHLKENALSGVRHRGWGISRVLANFRQAWYVQVLSRYNEAIALDYVIPFRLVTPAPGPGSTDQARDALLNLNMGGYMSQIQRMIRQRRRDPSMWHTLPFPVQYQALGGDATQLAPRDLLDQGLEVLLNNVGVPVELFKGSLQIQSAPAALRLFEASWSHLVHNLNGYLSFLMKRLCQLMGWEQATAKLKKVTHADDMQRNMARLQLMMSGQASKQTGLGSVGMNYYDEVRKQMEEQRFEAEQQDELSQDLENTAQMQQMGMQDPSQQGGMPPGSPAGAPPGGSAGAPPPQGGGLPPGSANTIASQPSIPNKPTTPEEMLANAQQMAQKILTMPESQKDSELIQLKKTDPTMHSLVRSQIDDIKRQAQLMGGQQLMQQQFGKQGSVLKDMWNYRGPLLTLPD